MNVTFTPARAGVNVLFFALLYHGRAPVSRNKAVTNRLHAGTNLVYS